MAKKLSVHTIANEIHFEKGSNMELNKKTVDNLLRLDDRALQQKVKDIAVATGVDARKAENATKDVRKIRRKLENITDADIRRAIDALGEENVNEIMRQLRK